ncbi:ASCH domain-containing protein [Chelativorans sp. ZYF759]|nr:ASCH domain-containing protein [Chelativorans sp. ZYF759]
MLFNQRILEGIAHGDVTLAFRRWKRQQIRPGTRLRTALGEVRIGEVRQVEETAVSEDDARQAGFDSLAGLWRDLREGEDRRLFRIAIDGLAQDTRVALREDAVLGAEETSALTKKLARWDKANGSDGYHRRVLQSIAGKPATPAVELAKLLDVEKLKLKRDIRKLKEIGLTESLKVGYRLSPRGRTFLTMSESAR